MKKRKLLVSILSSSLILTATTTFSLASTSCSATRDFVVNLNPIDGNFVYADKECTKIIGLKNEYNEELTIPSNVLEIGENVFASKPNLKIIDFSQCSNLIELPINLFTKSYNIEKIILPPNITKLNPSTFKNLNKLKFLNWPAKVSIENMKELAKNLSIYIPEDIDGDQCLTKDDMNNNSTSPYSDQRIILISNQFKQLGSSNDTNGIKSPFKSLNNVYSIISKADADFSIINDFTFSNMKSIEEIWLHTKISELKNCAFYKLDNLTTIANTNNWESLNKLINEPFKDLPLITEINISNANSLTQIDGICFKNLVSLTTIVLPDNLNKINSSFIDSCPALDTINMPKQLDFTASGLTNGTMLNKNSKNSILILDVSGTYAIETLNQLKDSSSNTFLRPNTKFVWFSNKCTSISNSTHVSWIDTGPTLFSQIIKGIAFEEPRGINQGMKIFNEQSFFSSNKTIDIQLPSSLTTIEQKAFMQTSMETLEISPNIIQIRENSFNNCENIKEIKFANNINTSNYSPRMFLNFSIYSYNNIKNCPDNFFLEYASNMLEPSNEQVYEWTYISNGYVHPDYPQFYFTNQNYTSVCGLTPLGLKTNNLVFPQTTKYIRNKLLLNSSAKVVDFSLCSNLLSIPEDILNDANLTIIRPNIK